MSQDIISVIDIGSSKVVCLIALVDDEGKLEILGANQQMSDGIHSGLITDIQKAKNSIIPAVNAAEKMANISTDTVSVNVSSSDVISKMINIHTNIEEKTVSQKHVMQIVSQGYMLEDEIYEIIHSFPVYYQIDVLDNISDPVGMYCDTLFTRLHSVGVNKSVTRNLENFLIKCRLNVNEIISSPYASAISCLNEDEKKLGTMLLDIGSDQTGIAVYENEVLKYTSSIPVAGSIITRDIAKGLNLSIAQAERLKILYGSVVLTEQEQEQSQEFINIVDELDDIDEAHEYHNEDTTISKKLLTQIITARVEEIFELVTTNLQKSDNKDFDVARVVLTGGTSQIQGIKNLASYAFHKSVRIARPKYIEGMPDAFRNPAFSCVTGMLMHVVHNKEIEKNSKQNVLIAEKSVINKFVNWFKSSVD